MFVSRRHQPPQEHHKLGGPLALAAVTLGLLTWPIAFNLGAYGVIFYENIFQVVVASSILFFIMVVNKVYEPPMSWIVRVALASPLLWLLAAGYVTGSTSEAMERPVFALWLALIGIVSIPLTLRLLVHLSMPELTQASHRRLMLQIIALVAIIGVIGFAVGNNHPRFLDCEDFRVAGAALPDDCVR